MWKAQVYKINLLIILLIWPQSYSQNLKHLPTRQARIYIQIVLEPFLVEALLTYISITDGQCTYSQKHKTSFFFLQCTSIIKTLLFCNTDLGSFPQCLLLGGFDLVNWVSHISKAQSPGWGPRIFSYTEYLKYFMLHGILKAFFTVTVVIF